ncbi:endo alpha-1,4 polygalactosaminidase [Actinoplanes sp. RD1]|uniref:endo alpha-1,4 polygalactosaminidase n=1 Tax=Actinoplanes sp. RD1 TaxID=3064538 RepID=UPI002741E48F|nr:endo alpha-1,4 polygalactosaminidase [Actinoplanes sp. RD1]
MAANRRKLTMGVAMAAVVAVALGAGIGAADAGTRSSWWSAKPAAKPTTKPAAKPSASATPVPTGTAAGSWAPPPADATFDYQIGGAYTPPAGVTVVSRDREATPAAGTYTICYVNAFQVQPGDESWWQAHHDDLLLKDKSGKYVIDEDWDEMMLDFSTDAKRTALTEIVGEWIDGCAAAGFRAIESDNLDSYTRSQKLLTQEQALAYATALNSRAHAQGLAAGQKNTAELTSTDARKAGFDFAVAEECADFDECDAYTATYGSNVIVIEYSRSGFAKACSSVGGTLSVVLRDVDVTTPGSDSYVYEAC